MPITDQKLSEGRDSDEADIKRLRYRYEGCFLREKTDELINPETIGSVHKYNLRVQIKNSCSWPALMTKGSDQQC